MSDEDSDLARRYYLDFATAFVRGKLAVEAALAPEALFRHGDEHGLRLHKFKRADELPRVRAVLGLLQSLYPSELLDIGSGRGLFLWPLLDTFPELPVTSVDVRPDRVADLQSITAGGVSRLRAVEGSTTQLPFDDGEFDGVTMLEVLEHLPEPEKAVTELVRVARRFIVVSVPSRADDNPQHIQLFDGETLSGLFRDAGARRVQINHVLNHIVALVMVDRTT